MDKQNVIKIIDYIEKKKKVNNEQECFNFLGSIEERIKMSETYAKSFRQYLDNMGRNGNIKQSFANDLNQQLELIVMTTASEISRRNSK